MRRTGRMLYAKNYNTIWSMCGKFCVGFQMIQWWLIVVGAEINCQTFIKSAPTSKINIMFPIVVENNLQSLPISGQKGGKRSCLITAWQGPTKALPCGFFYSSERVFKKSVSYFMDRWLIDELNNNVCVELMSVFV